MKTDAIPLFRRSDHGNGIFFILVLLGLSAFFHPIQAQFVKGADIGWLSQMEATGYKFYDTTGVEANCLQILQDHGINATRLRVWVNPSNDNINGHCSKKEVVAMALRAREKGMRVMIDFHYSDSWADPGKQNKPAAWVGHSFSQLLTDVYTHTFTVLDTLKSCGVTPAWVQVGNEITGGMLWPEGSTANWFQLAQLLNKGYDAVKAVDSSIRVVIHVDQGQDNARCRTFFDNASAQGVKYDIIGLSYYPYWIGTDYTATIAGLGNNLDDMVSRYGKEVMVVETGGDYTLVQNTYDMLVAVIETVKAVPGGKGLGVIYWEPEGAKSWSGYQLGCWGADGKPTAALKAFLTNASGIDSKDMLSGTRIYPNPCKDGLIRVDFTGEKGPIEIQVFDLAGRLVGQQKLAPSFKGQLAFSLKPGIYLVMAYARKVMMIEKLVVT
ncbi:MAG: glycosyl hydrolase 53 family protein [Bacteroidota bacterium]